MNIQDIRGNCNFIKEYLILKPVFKKIAMKFHVTNTVQIVFRLLLLKPYLLDGICDIANDIKNLT